MCLTVLVPRLRFYNVLAQVVVLKLHKKMALLSGSGELSCPVVVKLTAAQELFWVLNLPQQPPVAFWVFEGCGD